MGNAASPSTPKGLQAQVSTQAAKAWAAHDAGAVARQSRLRPTHGIAPANSSAAAAPVAPATAPVQPAPVKAKVASVGPGTTRSAAPVAAPFVPAQGRPAPVAKVGIGQARPSNAMTRAIAAAEASTHVKQ
jgi:hypothetical protein